MIRFFTPAGELRGTFQNSDDVVRALCKVPASNPTGAQFASASNDGIIRLYTIQGQLVGSLFGHESFVYSLAALPTGELVSAGEDRTVRVWNGTQCVQTITHPAISVWCVRVCDETGDIVTGASDRLARVFSRNPERHASPEVIRQFEEAVKGSAIPAEQVGKINKEKLPGPDFLKQKSGTKEGQVQMIHEEDGSVTAHTWSAATQEWVAVGTVVESAGSSGRKTEYLGEDYDYVFDIDIEDGKPPLKLPYNVTQNPYEVATKFIQDNELPISYLEQVANFIAQNTQGATIGPTQETAPSGGDPWGTDRRYRPGDASAAQEALSSYSESTKPVLPQTYYLSIPTGNIQKMLQKLQESNQILISEGEKEIALKQTEMRAVEALCSHLEVSEPLVDHPVIDSALPLVFRIATKWPEAHRMPGIDLIRLLAAFSPTTAKFEYDGENIITSLLDSGVSKAPVNVNHAMLAVRAFANLFMTSAGRKLVMEHSDHLLGGVKAVLSNIGPSPNRGLIIAIMTLYINITVYLTTEGRESSPESAEQGLALLEDLTKFIANEKDSEAVYRGLVALGTLVKSLGAEVKSAAKEVYEVESILSRVSGSNVGKEPRVKGVLGEIRAVL